MLCLSSRTEGFGNVIVEALELGVPVVSTDCECGPREILENGKWGRLVPVGDYEKMAEKIIETLFGNNALPSANYLQDRFGIESISNRYIDVLLGAKSSVDV